jgi:hypothetical protein
MSDAKTRIQIEHVPQPEGADRLSDILLAIAQAQDKERISIGDLLMAMQHRALGALIFIFAVPNALPVPPGVSAVLGAPLLFLTAQLMLGMNAWLPKFITDRSLLRVDFEKVIVKVAPWLAKAERLMRPRLQLLARGPALNVIGLLCLVLSIVLFLPIPLGNMLPAVALCILALGVLERDGVWVIIGALVGVVSVVIVWGIITALFWVALFVIGQFFGGA